MVKALLLLGLLVAAVAQAQLQPQCRPGSGVYLPPFPLGPTCITLNDPPPAGAPNIHDAWGMAGLRFPHPSSGDKVCAVLLGYVPPDYPTSGTGWTPNISLVGYRENGPSDIDRVNWTVAASYLGADGGQDIRAPRFGARISSDDIPNTGTRIALFEPWVMTIHDIPNPVGLGTLNVPGANRTASFVLCREDGPAHIAPFTHDGKDINEGAIILIQANLRWEDATNVRKAVYPIALTSIEQVDPVSQVLPQPGVEGTFLGFAENTYQLLYAYIMVPLWYPVDGNVMGACADPTAGNWPTCDTAHRTNTIDLHNGATEYMYLATEVPGDYVPGSEVKLDAEFYPGATPAEGETDYSFFAQTFFSPIGTSIATAPATYSEEAIITVSCNSGIRQQATFGSINMTQGHPGDKMFVRVGRRGAATEDTATAIAKMTGMRLFFKRKVQIVTATGNLIGQ